jgi:hypothetical protein
MHSFYSLHAIKVNGSCVRCTGFAIYIYSKIIVFHEVFFFASSVWIVRFYFRYVRIQSLISDNFEIPVQWSFLLWKKKPGVILFCITPSLPVERKKLFCTLSFTSSLPVESEILSSQNLPPANRNRRNLS